MLNDISIEVVVIVDLVFELFKVELSLKLGYIYIKYDLEGISIVLLMIRVFDNVVVWKMLVMYCVKGIY